ncbi:MAG: NifU family protein, partial [Desulfovibrio sp.]|nr:NifU family protein [Desulfovibrio sp.]
RSQGAPASRPAEPATAKPAACAAGGLTNLQRMQKVMETMALIRPQLQADGGDIELVDIAGKTVSVRLTGHCQGCPASQATLQQVVEQILRQQVEPDLVVEEVK